MLQRNRMALTFFMCPKQQSSPSHNLSALLTTLSSKLKRDSADNIHTGAQYAKFDKTYTLKQLLSTRGQSNNFPARRTTPRLLAATQLFHNFTLMSNKRQLRSQRVPQEYAGSLTPQA